MSIPPSVENSFHFIVDLFFSKWPQPIPNQERLKNCKIISHRGEHDNINIFENTIPAFDIAVQKGIWGIEFDIRWTKDLHPVVFHDPNLNRLFYTDFQISEHTLSELQRDYPIIPTLGEVIQRFGKKLHFMVEIKKEIYPDPFYQNQVFKEHFANLLPQKDYHILSLSPEMFPIINFIHKSAFLPISELNFLELSKLARNNHYCGITGHYLFLSSFFLKRHKKVGQKVGTGFVCSRNSLFRELNRGIDWIFSNHAAKLEKIRKQYLSIEEKRKV